MNPDLKREEEVPSYKGFDIPYRALYWVLLVVLAITVVYAIVVWPMVQGFAGLADREDAADRGPVVERTRPAGALLQQYPELEYEAFAAEQQHAVESYGWKDERAGIARVPLERAKELTLEQGLGPITAPSMADESSETSTETPTEH